MRVCHVIEAAAAGSGQMVIDLARFCNASGDDVTVICSSRRMDGHFQKELLETRGIKMIYSPMRREIGLHDIVDGLRLLRELYKAGPFEIIHGHSSKAGALVRIAGIFLPGAKKVYSAHGFITMAPGAPRTYRIIERILALFSDAIIAVSEGEGRHALSIGLPARKIRVIPNGTAVTGQWERERARAELGIPPEQTALGFVGRMESQKNPIFAVEAFAIASRRRPELHFYLIGEGRLLEKTKEAIERVNVQDKAHVLGFRDGRALMKAFDALVCGSDYETLPVTFIEALNAGIPIITRHVGGVEEAILEGETGFLAKAQTVEGLGEAMIAFAETTKERRAAIQKKAKRHAKKFTQTSMGAATRALYASLRASQRPI